MVCVEAQVDGLTTISSEESLSQLKASIGDLLESLSDTVDIFQTALHFVLLKVSFSALTYSSSFWFIHL